MLTSIQTWDNIQRLRINEEILKPVQLPVGNSILQEEPLVVKPTEKIRGKYTLADLVAKLPRDYHPSEENWGEPVGEEVW